LAILHVLRIQDATFGQYSYRNDQGIIKRQADGFDQVERKIMSLKRHRLDRARCSDCG